jgi:5-methylcytosine-specific restriction endonuclease McrA
MAGRKRRFATKPCENCGATIGPYSPSKLANYRFCGKGCRMRALASKPKRCATETKPCESCGESIKPKRRSEMSKRRFCSIACVGRANMSQEKTCVVCGKSYRRGWCKTMKYPSKYCSKKCMGSEYSSRSIEKFAAREAERITKRVEIAKARAAASLVKRALAEEIKKLPRVKFCRNCGHPIIVSRGIRRRTCVQCVASARRASKRSGEKVRRMRLSRSRMKIDPLLVFARDKWRCHICRCRTPKRLRNTNHDRAPEQDHIVTVASDGLDTWENLRCCCRKCNLAKSDKSFGQFDLGFPVTMRDVRASSNAPLEAP